MLFVVEYYTVFLLINYCPIDSERSKTCCSVRGRTACRFHGSLPGGRYVRPWQRRSCPADLPRTPIDGAAGHPPRPGRAARSLPPWPDPDGDGTHSVDGADSKRQIERNFVAKGLVAADINQGISTQSLPSSSQTTISMSQVSHSLPQGPVTTPHFQYEPTCSG
jgi:hypothetical protein